MTDIRDELDIETVLNGFNDKNTRDRIHTMIPGAVVDYDATKRTATIQPGVNKRDNNTITQYPPLKDVKVQFPGGGGYGISWEPVAGDTGGIFFSERSLAEWITQGGVVTPKSSRHHHISDAFFVPGIWPDNAIPHTHTGNGITIANDAGTKKIVLDTSGVRVLGDLEVDGDISASGGIEANGDIVAAAALPATSVSLLTHVHTTPAGPSGPPIVPAP